MKGINAATLFAGEGRRSRGELRKGSQGAYQPPPPPPPPPPPALPPPPLPEALPGGVEAEEMAEEKLFPRSEVKRDGEKAAVLQVPAYQAGL